MAENDFMEKENKIMEALQEVYDPELGLSVVDLDLIKEVKVGDELTEIKMILTTPFCPVADLMVDQVREKAEEAIGGKVKVTLLDEPWNPDTIRGW